MKFKILLFSIILIAMMNSSYAEEVYDCFPPTAYGFDNDCRINTGPSIDKVPGLFFCEHEDGSVDRLETNCKGEILKIETDIELPSKHLKKGLEIALVILVILLIILGLIIGFMKLKQDEEDEKNEPFYY